MRAPKISTRLAAGLGLRCSMVSDPQRQEALKGDGGDVARGEPRAQLQFQKDDQPSGSTRRLPVRTGQRACCAGRGRASIEAGAS